MGTLHNRDTLYEECFSDSSLLEIPSSISRVRRETTFTHDDTRGTLRGEFATRF